MRKLPKFLLVLVLVLTLVGCDQATKSIAKQELRFSNPVRLFGGFVHFQYAENQGAFLNVGEKLSISVRKTISVSLSVVILAVFIALLLYADKIGFSKVVSFSLLLAGSIGNLIDRLFNQARVVDFLIVGTKTIHTGILNVADLLITTGIITLFIIELSHKKESSK